MTHDYTRNALAEHLRVLRAQGYRYMVRDDKSAYINCYSIKPSKLDYESWGYANPNALGVLPSETIHCNSCTEIAWSNKKPTEIDEWLKVYDR